MKKTINITLIKSLIGRIPKHIEIANQLGLKKLNRTVKHKDNPCIRGMINKIQYLLKVEESGK
jgi:large subunit ribosomal protein L30